jgi:FKBP-type peptidyl-prolyl cis-trans isomerase FklB
MRRLMIVIAIVCLVPAATMYSQQDLPQGRQPGGQSQARPQGQGQPALGQQGGFNTAPGNQAGASRDPAYMQQVSYGLGRNFAMNLKDNEIDVDFNALMAGISDTLRGAQPKYTEQQLEATLRQFGQEMQQRGMQRIQQMAAKNQQEAANFLAENSKRTGVQTTPSGLQYQVIQQGQGGQSPTLADRVKCHYKGQLLNGTEFDSSARSGGPAEFGVNQVIDGWKEALQKMHVGDKWRLFVPPKLAYDMDPPRPPIEPGHLLVFDIELLEVVKK